MAEIRTIPETILASGIKDTSIDTIGKFSKKVIHHNAGPPTAADDTGLGYIVGSIWVDSTNGDMYTAADVTAEDANWKNMEGDNVNDPFVIQGSNYGYHHLWASPGGYPGVIDRFPISAGGASSDHGESQQGSYGTRGSIRNDTHSYHVDRFNPGPTAGQNIYRFSFTAPSGITDVGEHSNPAYISNAAGSTDGIYGFVMGGYTSPGVSLNDVEKFTMASPAPSAATGAEINYSISANAGVSDIVNSYMYHMGGEFSPPLTKVDTIERGAFSISSGNLTDHGEMAIGGARENLAGTQSPTYGYAVGGVSALDVIEKFAFGTGANTTDVGNLIAGKHNIGCCASPTHGHRMGGAPDVDTIDRWTFASDGNAVDFGELSSNAQGGSGVEN